MSFTLGFSHSIVKANRIIQIKSLQTLGWSSHFESDLRPEDLNDFSLGRVTKVNKTIFLVRNTSETITCELAGNLLSAQDEFDHPKTGN